MREALRESMLGLVLIAVLAGQAPAAAAPGEPDEAPRVVATYFHRTLRCQTCLRIEALARFDVTDVMADDVASGQLAWRLVDFQAEENAHFAEAYELDGPSLVVTLEAGGEVVKWTRLDRVWELYGDVAAFDAYVLGAVEQYLQEASRHGDAGAGDAKDAP